MPESGPIVQLPSPTTGTLVLVLLAFVGLFLLAIVIEVFRRKKIKRKQVGAAWRTIKEIVREKELSDNEIALLFAFIERWSPGDPLRVVTVRQHFDACVDSEIERLAARRDAAKTEAAAVALRDIRMRLGLDYVPFGQRIHSTRELYEGQSMFVAPASATTPNWTRMNVASLDEACFYMSAADKSPGAGPHLRPGDKVRCRMWREEDARYAFTAVLARHEEAPPLWAFHHTSELKRMQSRSHFRVRHNQTTSVGIVNAPVDGNMSDVAKRPTVTRFRGRITSLSAGGLALVMNQAVPRQVILRITVEVPDAGPLEVNAHIVSTVPISGGRHLVRAAFTGIEEQAQDAIARYVILRQQHRAAEDEKAK